MKNKKLQDFRIEKGLTIEQAAKILEISKQYLSMLENGHRNPSDSLKIKMAKLYDCEIIDIFLAINSTKRLKRKEVN